MPRTIHCCAPILEPLEPRLLMSTGSRLGPVIHSTSNLSEPRYGMGAAAVDGKAIFGGGADQTDRDHGKYTDAVDIYDPDTQRWSAAAPSQARYRPGAPPLA